VKKVHTKKRYKKRDEKRMEGRMLREKNFAVCGEGEKSHFCSTSSYDTVKRIVSRLQFPWKLSSFFITQQ